MTNSLFIILYMTFCYFKARQVLEREFNNLLALGTERSLSEVDCTLA
jgi:hypothetical protein